jgi:hypothetical protein
MPGCKFCAVAADTIDEYRKADAEWRENNPRAYRNGPTQWLVIRLRRSYILHCKVPGQIGVQSRVQVDRSVIGCTCQCRPPVELEDR